MRKPACSHKNIKFISLKKEYYSLAGTKWKLHQKRTGDLPSSFRETSFLYGRPIWLTNQRPTKKTVGNGYVGILKGTFPADLFKKPKSNLHNSYV